MERHLVAIVGAGFAGIGLGIRLLRDGIDDFVILERAGSLGGVWRDNTYPGVACDVPVHLYSYSFEPNPSWSRFFAPQREILAYLEHCADKYGVRKHIRFDAGVTSAVFDEGRSLWKITTAGGREIEARVLVFAAGLALTRPILPDIPGLTTFEGPVFHSSRWDATQPLDGKSVAVIGTGASAIQIVPAIAPILRRLTLYQRTAPWILPRLDHAIGPRARDLFRRRPGVQKAARTALYWILESMATGFIVDPRINQLRAKLALRHLARQVRDPELRAKLTPTFTLGCKRILFSNDYYPTLQRPHAEVVTDRIREIRGRTIVTSDGRERETDAIVCATGFEAARARLSFEIRGRGGRTLEETWKNDVEAYLGSAVAGFPNFFFVVGPNTGLGHSSMIFMMESQFEYLVGAIRALRANGVSSLEVKADVQRRYNDRIQERLAKTVWNTGGCASWYRDESGKNTTLWPGFTFEYRLRTRYFDDESYVAR